MLSVNVAVHRHGQRRRNVGRRMLKNNCVLGGSTPAGEWWAIRVVFMCHALCGYRQGAQFVEVWVDGYAFSDLSSRQEELTIQREELEKQKKQLTRKKAPVTSTLREQLEREEILKMRAAVLKKVG